MGYRNHDGSAAIPQNASLVIYVGALLVGMLVCRSSGIAVPESFVVSDGVLIPVTAASDWTTVEDTADTANVFYDGENLVIQNKLAAEETFEWTILAAQAV